MVRVGLGGEGKGKGLGLLLVGTRNHAPNMNTHTGHHKGAH
jgi:hypothetical protein